MMQKLIILAFFLFSVSCSQNRPDNFVLVKGGIFTNNRSKLLKKNIIVKDFFIGKYEVSQSEWLKVMANNPSTFKGGDLPVETVSWYDCIDYCNRLSLKEGLKKYYNIDKRKIDINNRNELDSIKWTVTVNNSANGYRLPTAAEWEFAAEGGNNGRGYTYSGSNDINEVAWYWKNSGDKYLSGSWAWPSLVENHNRPRNIGLKKPNELGLYDMSGNVREWCWDWHPKVNAEDAPGRIWKGGGWIGADFCCESTFEAYYQANGKGPDQGFRICRSF